MIQNTVKMMFCVLKRKLITEPYKDNITLLLENLQNMNLLNKKISNNSFAFCRKIALLKQQRALNIAFLAHYEC